MVVKDLVDVRVELEKARFKVEQQKVVALQSTQDLAEELEAWQGAQAQIAEVEKDLKSAITEHDAL